MFTTLKNEFNLLFTLSRVNRLRYFSFGGMLFIMFLLLCTAAGFVAGDLQDTFQSQSNAFMIIALAPLIISFTGLKIWLAVRRMNDRGRSIFNYLKNVCIGLIFIFLPTLLAQIPMVNTLITNDSIIKILTALSYVVGLITIIYAWSSILFFKGTTTANKYGSVPPANNAVVITFAILAVVNIFVILYMLLITALTVYKATLFADKYNHYQQQSAAMASLDTEPSVLGNDLSIPDPTL
jgi:uncharacterized membrane protein YhaH (DUF805 family)